MFKKMTLVMAVLFAGVLSYSSANAATLSIVGGTDATLPAASGGDDGFSLTGSTGLVAGTTVKAFDSTNSNTQGLMLSEAANIRFTYLGHEANFENMAIELAFGILFNNKTSTIGDFADSYVTPDANGLLPFKFTTDGGGTPAEAVNGDITDPLSIAFYYISDKEVIALFGDGYGDTDFDDLAVRISVVPLPPALALFGAALFGLGWLGRRRKTA